jgi:diadenosine tetraphosphatase ApaH/serine/threonine PP2A family protein phosphatase
MKILVVSDIHANLTALEAVLSDAEGFDSIWCLGDLVGYGPDPNECVDLMRSLPDVSCLIGNHDRAALGLLPLARFNLEAHQAASWTRQILSLDNTAFLEGLPESLRIDHFLLAHGSPRNPIWEYILDPFTAERNFDYMEEDYALVGHSHLPLVFARVQDGEAIHLSIPTQEPLTLKPQMILNPGSVGQPRDMDPRAAYAILDMEELSWRIHRVTYDVAAVQHRIREVGLPERQALRLESGW